MCKILLSVQLWANPLGLDSCQIYLEQSRICADSNQFKPALVWAKKAWIFTKKTKVSDSLAVETYSHLGKAYIPTGDYIKALKWQQQALRIAEQTYGEIHIQTAKIQMELSECYWRLSQLSKGLKHAQIAYHIFLKLEKEQHPLFAQVIGKLAGAYINLEDYSQAIIFYKKSLNLLKNKADFQEIDAAPAYYNIGNAYLGKQEPDIALPYFFKAMKLDQTSGADFYVADDLDNIALAYQQKKAYEKAIEHYDMALELYQKTVGLEHDYTAHAIKFKGECYLEMGEVEKAIDLLELALKLKEKLLGIHTKDVAICHYSLGNAYAENGNFCLANEAFLSAQYALKFDANQANFKNTISSYVLLESLNFQAKAFLKNYHNSCDKVALQESLKVYAIAIHLMDDLRSNYQEKDSKLDLARLFKQVLEGAITTAYESFLETKDSAHLQAIFTNIEKSKALLLLENLQQAKSQQLANLPTDLKQQVEDFQIQLAFLEQQQFEENQKTAHKDSIFLSDLDGKIFDLKQAQQVFIKKLKQSFPAYAATFKEYIPINLEKTQAQILKENQSMIQYFIGKEAAFAMLIQKEKVEIIRLADDFNYSYWMSLYRDNLYQFYEEMTIKQADKMAKLALQRSNWAAWKLYQHLVQPLEKFGLTKQLVFIPDGLLTELPFDALLQTIPSPNTPFKQYDFLIQKHQIAYAHSANVLDMMQQKANSSAPQSLVAFAPSFENKAQSPFVLASNRSGLSALMYNVPEVQEVQDLWGGVIYTKNAATEAQFLATAETAQIIHLSTHGKANDTIGDYSFLAFTEIPDDNENEFLYVKDLYHLNLEADMVVLSACETGLGELQEGEGILSLANGFAQAGAKSIITTLWVVNDAQTKNIMVDFYKNLKEGQAKDEALRQAKLQQLEKGLNVYAHPFYWAGFVGFGDMKSIRQPFFFCEKGLYQVVD